jgi:hypothetical protein
MPTQSCGHGTRQIAMEGPAGQALPADDSLPNSQNVRHNRPTSPAPLFHPLPVCWVRANLLSRNAEFLPAHDAPRTLVARGHPSGYHSRSHTQSPRFYARRNNSENLPDRKTMRSGATLFRLRSRLLGAMPTGFGGHADRAKDMLLKTVRQSANSDRVLRRGGLRHFGSAVRIWGSYSHQPLPKLATRALRRPH